MRLPTFAAKAWVVLFVLVPSTVWSWGGEGHHVIGAIADLDLKGTNAEQQVRNILSSGNASANIPGITLSQCAQSANCTLAKYAVWADCAKGPEYCPKEDPDTGEKWLDNEMRAYDRRFTDKSVSPANPYHHAFHYADIPIEFPQYSDDVIGANDHDIVHAIADCIVTLRDGSNANAKHKFTQREALFVLTHLVGDLHQPLHIGAIYIDDQDTIATPPSTHDLGSLVDTHGGNYVLLGSKNLHSYWDSDTVKQVMTNRILAADAEDRDPPHLAALLAEDEVDWKTSGGIDSWPVKWANETLILARERGYGGIRLGERSTVQDQHTHTNHLQWEVANAKSYSRPKARDKAAEQLAKAGHRLAALLQAIWP